MTHAQTVAHAGRAKLGLGKAVAAVVDLFPAVGIPAPTPATRDATWLADELLGIPIRPCTGGTLLLAFVVAMLLRNAPGDAGSDALSIRGGLSP